MSPLADTGSLHLDTRLLSTFIYELNISRRHVSAYPDNHPIIIATLSKVTNLLQQLLLTCREVTLGIAKDVLLVGDSYLDKNNLVYRDVARLFFSHGIVAVTFTSQLEIADLLNFYKILALKREDVDKNGGIIESLAECRIKGVTVHTINYGAFRAREENIITGDKTTTLEKQSALIWDSFVRNLLKGGIPDSALTAGNSALLDPSVVSEIFNKKFQNPTEKQNKAASYVHAITDFLKQLDENERGVQKEELLIRLSAFINKLSPELRRQFLDSAFASLANHHNLAHPLLAKVSEEAILDALDDLSRKNNKLPQMMLDLIGRLSSNLGAKAESMAALRNNPGDEQLREKLKVIFQEENPENKFIPENYLKALQAIVADNEISVSDRIQIGDLSKSVASHHIEEQVSHVILNIINNTPDECNSELMQRNLQELCGYFLNMGDFKELTNVYENMSIKSANSTEGGSFNILETFSVPEFIEEVLNGVKFWGKAKFKEISDLIDKIGAPFVEPMLDRLAEEQNMSMRRFYLERLQNAGTTSRNAAISRLRDNRWYFVRNIIILLANLGDATVIPYLRKMTLHPHLKVRQEAVKALLGLKDPEGENILLRDMDSGDKETIINAVRLAENSRSSEVNRRLIDYLGRGGLSVFDCELKSAAIHSLGTIGSPSTIQELERFLNSRVILRSSQLKALKIEVIQSLKKYPADAVLPLLKPLLQSGQNEIREAAEASFRQLKGGDRAA